MASNCPVCAVALKGMEYDGVHFEECPQCAGVWLLERDLRTLEARNVQDLDKMDALENPMKAVGAGPSAMVCPSCGKEMSRFHFMMDTPIELYRCETCDGLWIAHGELSQMAAAVDSANKPVTRGETVIAERAEIEEKFDEEHQRTMEHYQRMTRAFNAVSYRMLGWWI